MAHAPSKKEIFVMDYEIIYKLLSKTETPSMSATRDFLEIVLVINGARPAAIVHVKDNVKALNDALRRAEVVVFPHKPGSEHCFVTKDKYARYNLPTIAAARLGDHTAIGKFLGYLTPIDVTGVRDKTKDKYSGLTVNAERWGSVFSVQLVPQVVYDMPVGKIKDYYAPMIEVLQSYGNTFSNVIIHDIDIYVNNSIRGGGSRCMPLNRRGKRSTHNGRRNARVQTRKQR